jgi:hypothetical protein
MRISVDANGQCTSVELKGYTAQDYQPLDAGGYGLIYNSSNNTLRFQTPYFFWNVNFNAISPDDEIFYGEVTVTEGTFNVELRRL